MTGKDIVILGGGLGGIVAAGTLRKKLGDEHKITVIDKSTVHSFTPSYLWVMTGWREPSQVSKGLRLLSKRGIEFKNAEVVGIDVAKSLVQTSGGNLEYDYLIVSLGAELAPDALPGFSEGAYTPYTLEGAVQLRDILKGFPGGETVVLVSSLPFKCPAAPYEAALLIDHLSRTKKDRDKTNIQLFTPEKLPMGVAGPELGQSVVSMLEEKGIGFNPQVKPTRIDPEKREITFETGASVKYDLLVGVPPHKCPAVVRESDLAGETGWIPVDPKTFKTKHDNIYAIGDVTSIKLAVGLPLPKAGVFAHAQGEVAAENIALQIRGREQMKEFEGKGYCFIEIGDGKAGFASGNFYASPKPIVKLKKPGRIWHWGKVLFEKWWMGHWF